MYAGFFQFVLKEEKLKLLELTTFPFSQITNAMWSRLVKLYINIKKSFRPKNEDKGKDFYLSPVLYYDQ